ncbi:MAG: DNA sulfur modification protein DndB, partial [Bacteroidota bacterium]
MIHSACTRGNLGLWDYYSTVMKASDIVENNRIITVSESEELYTTNINEILQREIKKSRIKALTRYIVDKDERFLGCIVVAIHRGNPKWTEISIGRNFQVEGSDIDDSSVDFLSSKFGVLSLTGTEQIFALDGQHRLLGIRKSVEENPNLGTLEIPIIFVIHKHDNLERTRRLFTVLNKYAEKPKGAELIILDEDAAAAIISRRLVSNHEILSNERALSTSKSGNIPSSDNNSLTTLVTINAINKILFRKAGAFYAMRPSDNELDQLYTKAKIFWDTLFQVFPELVSY